MRLIEDITRSGRQQFAEAFLFQCEIGEQQVMVDDDEVGLLRGAARLHHETVGESRAVLAQTVVGGGGDAWPDRRVLLDALQLSDVAATGTGGEVL